LTPTTLTPRRFTDGFEIANGQHPGFRRNHPKGVCVAGYFEGNGNGIPLSDAQVFRLDRIRVIGRFSLGNGQPHSTDTPDAVHGLGLEFRQPDGQLWRTAMIDLPRCPFRTPEAFFENMMATDPATGKPDPEKLKAFAERHPETVAVVEYLKTQPKASGFANSSFYSLNAFRFINSEGTSIPVRWILTPMQPFEAADMNAKEQDKNYLFDKLIAQIHSQPLRWRLMIIVGQAGDPTNDPTISWPEDRKKVDVGTLTLDHIESDDTGAARDITFDPLVLPSGIGPSDDPFLSARSAVYSQSYSRRAGEPNAASAVTPAEVKKGD
jgi:catalase